MSDRWSRISPDIRQSATDGGQVEVHEAHRDGQARVTFAAPAGWRLERIALTAGFRWLRQLKSADGLVLASRPDGRWEAHIVECKKTVGDESWRHVRQQLHGTRIRLDALCGVLGIEVDAVYLYTAFRRDRIGAQTSPDPLLVEIPVGSSATPQRPTPEQVAGRLAWAADVIALPEFGELPHRRVPLAVADDVGLGLVELG